MVILMMPRIYVNLGMRVIIYIIVMFVPVLWMASYTTAYYRQNVIQLFESDSLELLDAAISDEQRLINDTRQFLAILSAMPGIDNSNDSSCRSMFLSVAGNYPRYRNIGVLSVDGSVVCSAYPVDSDTNITGRHFFQQVIDQKEFSIGEYRIDEGDGAWTLTVGYPLEDNAGNIRKVLFAIIDMSWLEENDLYLKQILPPGSTLTKIDDNGQIIDNQPESWQIDDAQFFKSSIIPEVLTNKSGMVEHEIKSEKRIFIFKSMFNDAYAGEMYVILGIPGDVIYQHANFILRYGLHMIVILSLLAIATMLVLNGIVVSRFSVLVNTAEKITQGEYGARTELKPRNDELSYLASAFDTMAAELEHNDRERNLVEQELKDSIEERERLINELHDAMTQVHTLRGLVPICMHCKKVRDDAGYWEQVEMFIARYSDAKFSHCICPECAEKYYAKYNKDKDTGKT